MPTAMWLSLLQHLTLTPRYSDHDSFLTKGQQAEFGKDLLPGTCCERNTSPLPKLLTPARVSLQLPGFSLSLFNLVSKLFTQQRNDLPSQLYSSVVVPPSPEALLYTYQ